MCCNNTWRNVDLRRFEARTYIVVCMNVHRHDFNYCGVEHGRESAAHRRSFGRGEREDQSMVCTVDFDWKQPCVLLSGNDNDGDAAVLLWWCWCNSRVCLCVRSFTWTRDPRLMVHAGWPNSVVIFRIPPLVPTIWWTSYRHDCKKLTAHCGCPQCRVTIPHPRSVRRPPKNGCRRMCYVVSATSIAGGWRTTRRLSSRWAHLQSFMLATHISTFRVPLENPREKKCLPSTCGMEFIFTCMNQ